MKAMDADQAEEVRERLVLAGVGSKKERSRVIVEEVEGRLAVVVELAGRYYGPERIIIWQATIQSA